MLAMNTFVDSRWISVDWLNKVILNVPPGEINLDTVINNNRKANRS
jgi:hypothetical protein